MLTKNQYSLKDGEALNEGVLPLTWIIKNVVKAAKLSMVKVS